MNTTSSIRRILRSAIGVTTGTVLIAGLSVLALAPGAAASDLDLYLAADSSEVVQEEAPASAEPTTEVNEVTPEAAEVVETDAARSDDSEDAAPVQEAWVDGAPVGEHGEDQAAGTAETQESEVVPTASSARVPDDGDTDEDEADVQYNHPGLTCPTSTVSSTERTGSEAIAPDTFVGEGCSDIEPAAPTATATGICESEQLSIELRLSNPGDESAAFGVLVVLADPHDPNTGVIEIENKMVVLAGGETATEVVQLSPGPILILQVSLDGGVLLDEQFDADVCLTGELYDPRAVLFTSCEDDERIVEVFMWTTHVYGDATFEVILDGEIELVDVAAAGSHSEGLVFTLQQDETLTVEVLLEGEVLLEEETVTAVECDTTTDGGSTPPPATSTTGTETPTAGGPTTSGTQPRVLARTGVDAWTVLLMAALLLAAGASLVALGGNAPRGHRQA